MDCKLSMLSKLHDGKLAANPPLAKVEQACTEKQQQTWLSVGHASPQLSMVDCYMRLYFFQTLHCLCNKPMMFHLTIFQK